MNASNDDLLLSDGAASKEKQLPPLPGRRQTRVPPYLRDLEFSLAWLAILLKTLRLQVFDFRRSRETEERPKVAVHRDRSKAFVRTSIHIAPLLGCIALVSINWKTLYILHDSSWFSTLAFVSKLHEILMQASIGVMLASWIRRELMHPDGLPLGGLFAIVQAANPAYLWSLEFWGSLSPVKISSFRTWRPVGFALVVTLSVLLASAVGPASNIAMLPRQGRFLIGTSTLVLNETESSLFPQLLDTQDIVSNACNASSEVMKIYGNGCPPNDYAASNSLRMIVNKNRNIDVVQGATELGGTTAWRLLKVWTWRMFELPSMPWEAMAISSTTQVAISGLLDFVSRDFYGWNFLMKDTFNGTQVEHEADSKVPYVSTLCLTTPFSLRNESLPIDPSDRLVFRDFNNSTFESNFTMGEVRSVARSESAHRILWLDVTPEYHQRMSLRALIIAPNVSAACTFKAAWGEATINTTSNGAISFSAKALIQFEPFVSPWMNYSSWPNEMITITPQFMQQVIPGVSDLKPQSSPTMNLADLGVNPPAIIDDFLHEAANFYEDTLHYAEVYLSNLLAAAISRVKTKPELLYEPYYSYKQASCNGQVGEPDWSLADLGMCGPVPPLQESQYHLTIRHYLLARGYYLDDTPTYLALSILLLYCAFVIAHIAYTLWTGISSGSWDTVAEITLLALHSREPPEDLHHTSAGVATMRTFSHPVGIRARKKETHEKLELVFIAEEGKESETLSKPKKNKRY